MPSVDRMADVSSNEVMYIDVLQFKGDAQSFFQTTLQISEFLKVISVDCESYRILLTKEPSLAVDPSVRTSQTDVLVYTSYGCDVPIGKCIRFELKHTPGCKREYSLCYYPSEKRYRPVINLRKVKYESASSPTEQQSSCSYNDITTERDKRSVSPIRDSKKRNVEDDRDYRRKGRRSKEETMKLFNEIKTQILDLNMKMDRLKNLIE